MIASVSKLARTSIFQTGGPGMIAKAVTKQLTRAAASIGWHPARQGRDILADNSTKRGFDLIFGSYTREAHLCSRYCIPHLNSNRHLSLSSGLLKDSSSPDASKAGETASAELKSTMEDIKNHVNDGSVQKIKAVYLFDLKKDGAVLLDLKNGSGKLEVVQGLESQKADVTFQLSAEDFTKMFRKTLDPTSAFMSGKLKIKGELGVAMKLMNLIKNIKT